MKQKTTTLKKQYVFVFLSFILSQFTFAQTNIASSGTGAIWTNITAALSTSNATKVNKPEINDGNKTVDVVYPDVTGTNNWQALGIVWANPQSGITSIKFYNGFTSDIIMQNGVYSANIKVQSSADGTTWQDVTGWTINPSYPYSSTNASNQMYTLSGAAINNVLGVRVIGQVRTAANEYQTSWALKAKELEVFNTPSNDSQAPTTPLNLAVSNKTENGFTLSWAASTDNVGVREYEIFKDGVSIGISTTTNFNVSGLMPNTDYSMTVFAKDDAGNTSASSLALVVKTAVSSDVTAPSNPTSLISSAVGSTSLTLNWAASTDNIAVTGYDIYSSNTLIGSSNTNTFLVSGLTPNTNYSFTVKAKDAAGNLSGVSNALAVKTLIAGVSSYSENFDNNVLNAGWRADQGYAVKAEDQALKVKIAKNLWEEFSFDTFGSPLDISSKPVVSFRVRSEEYVEIGVALLDQSGNSNRDQYFAQPYRLVPDGDYVDVSYDFTNALGSVNPSQIVSIRFVVDPQVAKNTNLYIDDFKIGTSAKRYPRMTKPIKQYAGLNAGTKNIVLRGITLGATVTATSSNTTVVPNPTVSAVDANGLATLSYTPNNNQSGILKIFVKVQAPGKDDLIMPFDLFVNANLAPTIDAVADLSTGAVLTEVALTGITDGNPEIVQALSLTATSSDQSVIKNSDISFSYSSPQSKAILKFTPQAVASGSKSATITVSVQDNGGTSAGGVNTKTTSFKATVYNSYYNKPTANSINDNLFAYIGKTYSVLLKGISDGNGGRKIASITGVSSKLAVVSNVNITYNSGDSTAIINYTALSKDTTDITVTLTNTGAPLNSNGNTSNTLVFKVRGVDSPIKGYSETFETYGVGSNPSPNVLGADYYTNEVGGETRVPWMTNIEGYPQKWYIEGQGSEQTLTINPGSKTATLNVNKPSFIPRTFAGTWFSPRRLLDLSSNKYLSITVSANKESTLTFDIWDVTNKRYGLLPTKTVTTTPQTFTFVFDQAPNDAGFDFSKVASVLLNTELFADVNTTFTFYDLKIGDKADNAPPSKPEAITFDPLITRNILVNTKNYPVAVTSAYVIKDGIDQEKPVTITATSSNIDLLPNPIVGSVINGSATITLNPNADKTGSSVITVKASSPGLADKIATFTLNVLAKDATPTTTIAINQNQSFQKISGIGTYLFKEETVTDMGASVFRIDVGAEMQYGLEGAYNDNDDPNVLDLTKFNYTENVIKQVNTAIRVGMKKFIGAVWTPPLWMKGSYGYAPQVYNSRNYLLPEFYDEFAEYILGMCVKFKDEFGIEMYSISLQNEPEFNSSGNLTATCVYTSEQMIEVTKRCAARLKQAGLSTFIHGPESLPAQGTVLSWLQGYNDDPIAENSIGAFAIHSYSADAVNPGQPNDAELTSFYNEAQSSTHKKELWMTETSGFTNDEAGFMGLNSMMFTYFANGCSLWNHLQIGPEQPYIYGIHKNYAKYIRPGAVRLGASSPISEVGALAFTNDTDTSKTIVILNTSNSAKQIQFTGIDGFPQNMKVYTVSNGIYSEFQGISKADDGYLTLIPAKSLVTLHGSAKGDIVLPVNLISFEAKAVGAKAKITWATASEINNSHFEVFKSADGVAFSYLDKISAKGTQSNYTLYDNEPANGINYYRLIQYDLDGKATILGTRSVNFSLAEQDITIYPNPSSGELNVNMAGYSGKSVKVALFDLSGKIIHQEVLDVSTRKGVYQLHLLNKPITGSYVLQLSGIGLYKSYKVSFK